MAVDISNLLRKLKSLTSTWAIKITGAPKVRSPSSMNKGILRYRGYSIEELAEKSSSWRWPTCSFSENFPQKTPGHLLKDISTHTLSTEDVKKILDGFPSSSHPWAFWHPSFALKTAFYPESLDPNRSAPKRVYLSKLQIARKKCRPSRPGRIRML